MPISSYGSGRYGVSGTGTLNLRWSQLQGTARNDEVVLNKKNIGGWASINMGAGEDTVTLAASGDYTLQLIGVETIRTTAADTTLRLRSDATTSTDGSFTAITAMYGVQNITYTAATGAHSTISLGALDDKVTFSGAATNWIYNKAGSTIYAYDLTTNFRVALDSDVEIVNFAGTDLTAAAITTGKLYLTEYGTSDISGLDLQGAPTEVISTAGNYTLVATAAQLAAITTFDGLAGTDQITLSAAGTFDTTGKTLTSIEVINGSSGADTITVTTAGITTNGNDGADTITGSTGADTINGGAGVDIINGGGGADTITAGDDADIIIIATAGDHATNEVITGGAGSDTIRFTSTAAGTLALLVGVTDADGTINVVIGNAAGLTTGTTAENVNADALVNTLKVNLTGNDGANILTGNASDDTITGGAGADTINGGDGADRITGGGGSDTIDGGAGIDTYVFTGVDSGSNGFDTLYITSGDIIIGTTSYSAITTAGGAQTSTNLVTVADVITALEQKILGGAADLNYQSYLVNITDNQVTAGTDYSGWYFVSEFAGFASVIDSFDIVTKLVGVSVTSSIAFNGDDVWFTV